MFGHKEEIDFSMVQTSSKEALLRSALAVCNNDLRKADEICEYFMKRLPNMPDVDPTPPSAFDQIDVFADRLSALGERYPAVTNGVGNIFMTVLKNSKFGAYLQPVADAAATVAQEAPASPVL